MTTQIRLNVSLPYDDKFGLNKGAVVDVVEDVPAARGKDAKWRIMVGNLRVWVCADEATVMAYD